MKSTIIFLGLVALTFTTANATNEFKYQDLNQQESATAYVVNTQNESQLAFENQVIANSTASNNEADTTVFNPNSVVKEAYVKTVEDVISENKLITESQEEAFQPLKLATTIEDKIEEDNQIIESAITDEVYPLDFEKINRTVKFVIVKSNTVITADLKL